MTVRCLECGSEQAGDAAVCARCGAPIARAQDDDDAPTYAGAELTVPEPAAASDTPPARRRRLLQVTGVAIALAVAAGVIAGTVIDQPAAHPANVGTAARLSGQVHDFTDQIKGLNDEVHGPDGQGIFSVAFSPDGDTLAIGDGNGTISTWDVTSMRVTGAITDPESGSIYSLAFSPDGQTIAAGDGNGTTYLWNVGTGRLSAQVAVSGAVSSAAFSPSGRMLAVGDSNGTAYVWSVAALYRRKVPPASPLNLLTSPVCDSVYSVAFSASGRTLAVGCDQGSVLLWNLATRTVTAALTIRGAGGMSAVAFSTDGRMVAAVDEGGHPHLWDVATRHLTPMHAGVAAKGADSVAFSPNGSTLATGDANGAIYLWDLSGHVLATLADPNSAGVRSVAFSPDGATIAAGGSNGTTYLWNASW
jgi:WD40 repeat protein